MMRMELKALLRGLSRQGKQIPAAQSARFSPHTAGKPALPIPFGAAFAVPRTAKAYRSVQRNPAERCKKESISKQQIIKGEN